MLHDDAKVEYMSAVFKSHKKVIHPKNFLKELKGVNKLNRKLALRLGNALGSMGFFYICVVLDLVELPPVIQADNAITWITYLAQTVIQLIALPILSVQANIQAEKKEASDDAVHVALTHVAQQVDKLVNGQKS